MTEERRSETPVSDGKLRAELNVSVLIQGLILLGIVAMVTVQMGMRVDLAAAHKVQEHLISIVQDHELRIRANEDRIRQRMDRMERDGR